MNLAKTIVIKPTMNCNLRCGYCYEFLRNGTSYCKSDMNIEQLTKIARRVANLFPNSKILWMFHGGEPLLQNPRYFEKFADCIRELNKSLGVYHRIALQTNATLLTQEYVDIFEKSADLLSERIISISIDGTKNINDETRHFSNGTSPYSKILNGIETVKKSSLAFSTISVIGTHNVKKAKEIFDFIKNLDSNLCKFVPCYNSDKDGNSEKYGIRPLEFANFMCEMFDYWVHNAPSQSKEKRLIIEPIASIICNLSKATVTWCEYREEKCSNFTCIYPNGEMWLCDNFIHESMKETAYVKDIFKVSDSELKEILLTPEKHCSFNEFYEKMMSPCRNCDIFEYCKGGCISTRYEMQKKSPELHEEYCEAKKLLINHIKKAVESALS